MIQLTIEDLASSGEGVGTVEGKKVFIDGALPGERVHAEVTLSKKRYSKAKLLRIENASPYRVNPICPLFGLCGGCQIMHLSYPEQLAWKQRRVANALRRIGGLDIEVAPCEASPKDLEYRNKIVLEKGGFHKRHSHEIVPIPRCYIHNSLGEKALAQTAGTQKATIRTSFASQEVMIIKDGKANRDFIIERLGPLQFKIRPKDFFQINPLQAVRLYEKAVELAQLSMTTRVLDAYCGVGCLSLFAALKAKEVVGIETGRTAIKSAKENALLNTISNAQFICGAVEQFLPKLGLFDTVFLNPPREGVAPKVIEALLTHSPNRLLYISCDPATLSRDLKALKEAFHIEKVIPFDMFPQTVHVETVVVLNKNSRGISSVKAR